MQTKLERIAEIAKERPEERFISLVHLINPKGRIPRLARGYLLMKNRLFKLIDK
jgi:hypothetical protein